jgi:hypothetical protein
MLCHNGFLWCTMSTDTDSLRTFSLRLPAELDDEVTRIARSTKRSKNAVVNLLLQEALLTRKSGRLQDKDDLLTFRG